MPILKQLSRWIDDAATFRATSGVAPETGGSWPEVPTATITVLGAPAVGKSTLLGRILAPATSPFVPVAVSMAYRDAAAYVRPPEQWSPGRDSTPGLDAVVSRTSKPEALLESAFGLRLREAWGLAAGEDGQSAPGMERSLRLPGRHLRVLVLRAEAALSRGELEGVGRLVQAKSGPDLVVVNSRGALGAKEREEVRAFVAGALREAGCKAPVLVADLGGADAAEDVSRLDAELSSFLLGAPEAKAALQVLGRAALGRPEVLQVELGRVNGELRHQEQALEPRRSAICQLEAELEAAKQAAEAERQLIESTAAEDRRKVLEAIGDRPPAHDREAIERAGRAAEAVGLPPPTFPKEAVPFALASAGALGLAATALIAGDRLMAGVALLAAAATAIGLHLRTRTARRTELLARASAEADRAIALRTAGQLKQATERLQSRLAELEPKLASTRGGLAAAETAVVELGATIRRLESSIARRAELAARLARFTNTSAAAALDLTQETTR